MKNLIKISCCFYLVASISSCSTNDDEDLIDVEGQKQFLLEIGFGGEDIVYEKEYDRFVFDQDRIISTDYLKQYMLDFDDNNANDSDFKFNDDRVLNRAKARGGTSEHISKSNVRSILVYIQPALEAYVTSIGGSGAKYAMLNPYNNISNCGISFGLTSSISSADVKIGWDDWSALPNWMENLPSGNFAVCAAVEMNFNNEAAEFVSINADFKVGQTFGGFLVTNDLFVRNIIHEFGHVLFLDHPNESSSVSLECTSSSSSSTCGSEMMAGGCCHNYPSTLNADEKKSLRYMYPEEFTNFNVSSIVNVGGNNYAINYTNSGGIPAILAVSVKYPNTVTEYTSDSSCADSPNVSLPSSGIWDLEITIRNYYGDVQSSFIVEDWSS